MTIWCKTVEHPTLGAMPVRELMDSEGKIVIKIASLRNGIERGTYSHTKGGYNGSFEQLDVAALIDSHLGMFGSEVTDEEQEHYGQWFAIVDGVEYFGQALITESDDQPDPEETSAKEYMITVKDPKSNTFEVLSIRPQVDCITEITADKIDSFAKFGMIEEDYF